MRFHLDTDFFVYGLSHAGKERRRLLALADSDADIEMSAIAWYEFARGPRTPDQLAGARLFLSEDSVIPFDKVTAEKTAEVFRLLGSPRKRAADVAIGVTASIACAVLLTRNARDFAGIPELEIEATL